MVRKATARWVLAAVFAAALLAFVAEDAAWSASTIAFSGLRRWEPYDNGRSPLEGALSVADIDADGRPDLTTPSGVLRNTSTGPRISFAPAPTAWPRTSTTPATSNGIAVTDLTNDRRPEVLGINGYNGFELDVFQNQSGPGAIAFGPARAFSVDSSVHFGASGDLNGDRRKDVALRVSGTYPGPGQLAVLRNATPAGGQVDFAKVQQYFEFPRELTHVVIADLDADGKRDVAAISGDGFVYVRRNTATTGYVALAPVQPFPLGARFSAGLAAKDVTGDHKRDLVVPHISFTNTAERGVSILRNTSIPGDISFAPPQLVNTRFEAREVRVEDLNGDHKADIGVSATLHEIAILQNTSSDTTVDFAAPVLFTVNRSPLSFAFARFNADAKPDLAAAGGYALDTLRNVTP